MPSITTIEAERGFIDYTLKYGKDWSVSAKRNTPILRTDVSTVYFYVKETEADDSPIISLSDSSSSQIEWLSETLGKIRVKLGTNTEGHVGDNQVYELRIKFADNSFLTMERGTINVRESYVDTP